MNSFGPTLVFYDGFKNQFNYMFLKVKTIHDGTLIGLASYCIQESTYVCVQNPHKSFWFSWEDLLWPFYLQIFFRSAFSAWSLVLLQDAVANKKKKKITIVIINSIMKNYSVSTWETLINTGVSISFPRSLIFFNITKHVRIYKIRTNGEL